MIDCGFSGVLCCNARGQLMLERNARSELITRSVPHVCCCYAGIHDEQGYASDNQQRHDWYCISVIVVRVTQVGGDVVMLRVVS